MICFQARYTEHASDCKEVVLDNHVCIVDYVRLHQRQSRKLFMSAPCLFPLIISAKLKQGWSLFKAACCYLASAGLESAVRLS